MRLANVRGTRDYLPKEAIVRERIIDTLKEVFMSYGYSPLDTPALEYFDLLSAKYAGGAEILKETFRLKDLGGRILGLRYDLTVPFSRVIALNPQLKMPFKRYQIAKVWRNGPIGLGRFREFLQCDVDVVGSKSMKADAEILAVADSVFKKLKLNVEIRVNNRKVMNAVLNKLGVKKTDAAIMILDKIQKVTRNELIDEFKEKGIPNGEEILKRFNSFKNINLVEKFLGEEEGIKELKELFVYAVPYKLKLDFDPFLARGLSFYTGTVFECFLKNNKIKSAVASGGRYDKIIAKLLNSKQEYPSVGISFGLDRIYEALLSNGLAREVPTTTRVFVLPIGDYDIYKEAIKIAEIIRGDGINAQTDIIGRGVSKNLNYVNSLSIPYVIFIGKKEVETGKYKLRDMKTGKEKLLGIKEIKKILASNDILS